MRIQYTTAWSLAALVILSASSLAGCGSSAPSATPSASVAPSSAVATSSGPTSTPGSTTGTIVFGTTVDSATMSVASPITRAALSSPFGWIAHLSEPAGATTLSLTVASITANGNENPVSTTSVAIPDPQAKDLVHPPDTAFASLGGGDFQFRYIRSSDGKVLAAGKITFTN